MHACCTLWTTLNDWFLHAVVTCEYGRLCNDVTSGTPFISLSLFEVRSIYAFQFTVMSPITKLCLSRLIQFIKQSRLFLTRLIYIMNQCKLCLSRLIYITTRKRHSHYAWRSNRILPTPFALSCVAPWHRLTSSLSTNQLTNQSDDNN